MRWHSFPGQPPRVFEIAFDAADVGPIETGIYREYRLRKSGSNPQSSNVPGDSLPRVHARSEQLLGALNHGLWSYD
jgi:hypothetical protein